MVVKLSRFVLLFPANMPTSNSERTIICARLHILSNSQSNAHQWNCSKCVRPIYHAIGYQFWSVESIYHLCYLSNGFKLHCNETIWLTFLNKCSWLCRWAVTGSSCKKKVSMHVLLKDKPMHLHDHNSTVTRFHFAVKPSLFWVDKLGEKWICIH